MLSYLTDGLHDRKSNVAVKWLKLISKHLDRTHESTAIDVGLPALPCMHKGVNAGPNPDPNPDLAENPEA